MDLTQDARILRMLIWRLCEQMPWRSPMRVPDDAHMFKRVMFPAGLLSLVAAFPAVAAQSNIKPMAQQDCDATAKAISQAIGIPLKVKIGTPTLPEGLHGNACLLSGEAKGLTLGFEAAQDKIAAVLEGWQHLTDQDADGPFSTFKGFAKNSQRIFYSLSEEPPRGTCENKPIGDCKVPPRRWTWSFTAAAFQQ